ncbi:MULTISPECIES: GDSL-type esterase/lipase family protein [Mameliella]|uniref:GDSL-type esterase/lipase family protein n=1 Tax=Mameliella TaxID=1434019 RepID=UPI000B52A20A|nr:MULTISPECIES: GDSL-type esterase/lipase family protein [Mameliella]MCR9272038.1 GDSL-type esterase/lipase family protein [Paracoccaceae bacterium]OWV62761.1 GDSL family lipase [Mameliella alba]
MKTILCYGDSNTHGTAPLPAPGVDLRHPPGDRWPDVMARELGAGFRVIDEGLPGRTTVHDDLVEGGMRNGATVLPAILHSHKPIDLMVLMLGTNDLKIRFSVSAWEIARSVERLALMARAEGVVRDIVLVSPVPVQETGALREVFAGAEARQAGMEGFIEAAAERQEAGFLRAGDHVAVSPKDGVHWEPEAHHRFGKVLAGVVAERLA